MVTVKICLLRDITPFGPAKVNRHFRGMYRLHLHGRILSKARRTWRLLQQVRHWLERFGEFAGDLVSWAVSGTVRALGRYPPPPHAQLSRQYYPSINLDRPISVTVRRFRAKFLTETSLTRGRSGNDSTAIRYVLNTRQLRQQYRHSALRDSTWMRVWVSEKACDTNEWKNKDKSDCVGGRANMYMSVSVCKRGSV